MNNKICAKCKAFLTYYTPRSMYEAIAPTDQEASHITNWCEACQRFTIGGKLVKTERKETS